MAMMREPFFGGVYYRPEDDDEIKVGIIGYFSPNKMESECRDWYYGGKQYSKQTGPFPTFEAAYSAALEAQEPSSL